MTGGQPPSVNHCAGWYNDIVPGCTQETAQMDGLIESDVAARPDNQIVAEISLEFMIAAKSIRPGNAIIHDDGIHRPPIEFSPGALQIVTEIDRPFPLIAIGEVYSDDTSPRRHPLFQFLDEAVVTLGKTVPDVGEDIDFGDAVQKPYGAGRTNIARPASRLLTQHRSEAPWAANRTAAARPRAVRTIPRHGCRLPASVGGLYDIHAAPTRSRADGRAATACTLPP